MDNFNNIIISPYISEFKSFCPKLKIVVLASGEGTNFQILIDLANKNKLDIEISLLITDNINAKCIEKAKASEINYVYVNKKDFSNNDEFEDHLIEIIKRTNSEFIIMAGWMKIMSKKFINAFKNKIINIHPSLLPSFKGSNAIKQTLECGCRIAGCSVHFVEEEVDSGDLIIQGSFAVDEADNEKTLTSKMHSLEHKILPMGIYIAGLNYRNNTMDKN